MPRLLVAVALGLLAAALPARQPPPAAPPPPQEGAPPKGDLIKLPFAGSKIFPGTTRDVTIYVPKQYDGTTPACVHVHQDGVQYNAPAVFDRLIAEKKLPVIIGVFATPGRVPALDGKLALDRFNRSYEYDGLGPNYANFVIDELLPWVETQKTSDGRALRLSKSGNDRSIGGGSSGAVCAFTAAWERPDAFSRVFSSIGTYVGLRGAQDYSTLVRKVEPKPIRIFLEDGSNDLNIYGGDWWMANQSMERSLTFAGYEVKHQWGDGGHDGKLATKLFPEAMAYLWSGWPAAVKTGAGSAPLREVVKEGEGWREVGAGYEQAAAVTALPDGEFIFCTGEKASQLYRTKNGKPQPWAKLREQLIGLSRRPDGRFIGSCIQGVVEITDAGKETVLEPGQIGQDVVVRGDGRIYLLTVNDRRGGIELLLYNPGVLKQAVDTPPRSHSYLTMSPDQSLLYTAGSNSHWVYSYQIQPDGSLKHKQKFYHLHTSDENGNAYVTGMCCDTDGRLYVATTMGVQVCDQAGRVNFILPLPGNAQGTRRSHHRGSGADAGGDGRGQGVRAEGEGGRGAAVDAADEAEAAATVEKSSAF